jgi:5-formyltetrahydrofolate cyclo-ligase
VVASFASAEIVTAASAKASLRASMVARLKAVDTGERLRAARDASARLVDLLMRHLPSGAPLALFAATPTELPCDEVVVALAGRHPLLFPRLDGERLVFAEAAPSALARGRGGIHEPSAGATIRTPAAVVLPGRAFDGRGFRLGRGAGHYDRALAALPPDVLLVGYAYALQVVDSLPAEPHDVPVHVVVTEAGEPLHVRPRAVPHASPTATSPSATAHD